ncbi:MAG: SRPBCC family protein [Ilumatobacter sp.]|uniref:SRPBCC family protein n=1 Tax=Ilumatobacter sp. TaxID=1967498 RepID=UPI00329A38C7
MKYADCPTTETTIDIAAPASVVWDLVSDIELSSKFSSEVSGADWVEGHAGPSLDARFVGHSAHDAIGEWSTTCVVTGFEAGRLFEWSVLGTEGTVSSIWRYTIDDLGDGNVRLSHRFQMGPGRGGLNFAIDRMPEKEERIVANRMAEHELNMKAVLDGVKDVAESTAGSS